MSSPVASSGGSELLDVIRGEIAAHGPMTFARFMELALYHPQWGYYTAGNGRARIGRGGDYFTNISVGSVFGELLAVQFADVWLAMGQPTSFDLIELGAHRGQLIADIRAWAEREHPGFTAALRVRALDYPGELPKPITGCIFSNELLDAMPVHLITRIKGEWLERYVIFENGHINLTPGPLSCDALREEVARLPLPAVDGYVSEVHLEAGRWMDRVAHCLQRGFVLTIDYGYPAADYYAPHRKNGTLLCYHQHRSNSNPLLRVGKQDITAHVNFSALAERGAVAGLPLLGYCDQTQFIGALVETTSQRWKDASHPRDLAALKTLLHPELMGRVFKVLVQYRGMEHTVLAGLKFAHRSIV